MADMQLGSLTPSLPEPAATPGVAAGATVQAVTLPDAALPAAATTPAELLLIAHQVGQGLRAKSGGLDYRIDMINGAPRIRIIDSQTMQIIRQIPSDEVLTIHRALGGSSGVLMRQSA